jgi:hypothetical protein
MKQLVHRLQLHSVVQTLSALFHRLSRSVLVQLLAQMFNQFAILLGCRRLSNETKPKSRTKIAFHKTRIEINKNKIRKKKKTKKKQNKKKQNKTKQNKTMME